MNRIRRQNEIIANCQRTVAETEEIGIETIAELKSNREKIESAREKVSPHSFRQCDGLILTVHTLYHRAKSSTQSPTTQTSG